MAQKRKIELELEYSNYIQTPPVTPQQMYGNACSSDGTTVNSWRDVWIRNIQENHKRFGSFVKHGMSPLFDTNRLKPAIIVGSGPSLGYNGHLLKDRAGITTLSCLHNYHFFEDRGIDIDYYVTLDAGPVVIEEVYEGGTKTPEEYWASTKGKKLCAFIGTDPKFFDLWQGEVFLFNAPIPDPAVVQAQEALEIFNQVVSNGGNVLGACLYIAKAVLGSPTVAFVGADFSFGYNVGKGHKFHAWDSKYDAKLGNVIRGFDVFGNKVLTWPSYFNFKNFFDWVALTIPGTYVNCTEGGMFGAFAEGNIMAVQQMPLEAFIKMHTHHEFVREIFTNPDNRDRKLLY